MTRPPHVFKPNCCNYDACKIYIGIPNWFSNGTLQNFPIVLILIAEAFLYQQIEILNISISKIRFHFVLHPVRHCLKNQNRLHPSVLIIPTLPLACPTVYTVWWVNRGGGGWWKSTDWAVQAFRHGPSIALVQFRTPAALSYVPLLSWFSPHARENREGTKNCEILNSGGNSVKFWRESWNCTMAWVLGWVFKAVKLVRLLPSGCRVSTIGGRNLKSESTKNWPFVAIFSLEKKWENVHDDF